MESGWEEKRRMDSRNMLPGKLSKVSWHMIVVALMKEFLQIRIARVVQRMLRFLRIRVLERKRCS